VHGNSELDYAEWRDDYGRVWNSNFLHRSNVCRIFTGWFWWRDNDDADGDDAGQPGWNFRAKPACGDGASNVYDHRYLGLRGVLEFAEGAERSDAGGNLSDYANDDAERTDADVYEFSDADREVGLGLSKRIGCAWSLAEVVRCQKRRQRRRTPKSLECPDTF
jgi:hypothetical protein